MERPVVEYVVGVDLGQAADYTALCILEVQRAMTGFDGLGHVVDLPIHESEQKRRIVHLERFPLGMAYPAMVDGIGRRLMEIPRAGRGPSEHGLAELALVVDATGVGRPVVDLLTDAELDPVPITITGGDLVSFEDGYWKVPKRDLVSTVKVLQQRRLLQVQQDLALAAVLTRELQSFKYKISLRGHDSYGVWREGGHDDLVLAVALACWAADHSVSRRGTWEPSPFTNYRG